jgi:hypothetical protein
MFLASGEPTAPVPMIPIFIIIWFVLKKITYLEAAGLLSFAGKGNWLIKQTVPELIWSSPHFLFE